MSGTEFEKAAGREKAKKWKTSVRVASADGKQGEMIGDWLAVGAEPNALFCVACFAFGCFVHKMHAYTSCHLQTSSASTRANIAAIDS